HDTSAASARRRGPVARRPAEVGHFAMPPTPREPETVLPEGWPRPKGYANGVRVPAGWDLLAVAGMVGWDESERLVSDEFCPQFEQALRNVTAVVAAAGGQARHL